VIEISEEPCTELARPALARYVRAGADFELLVDFLAPQEAARLYERLLGGAWVQWRQDHLRLGGRCIALPRLTAWYGEPGTRYRYSGIVNTALPWDAGLQSLAARVAQACGVSFNGVLLNLYRDGSDSVSWHSDDEPELGAAPVIGSLSVGAARPFQLRHKDYRRNGLPMEELVLRSGSLLVMRGSTQRCWQHRLPKQVRHPCGPRVNLSFRWIEAREV
jgi:alkylated DNA repair dioxygenase AlkB